MSLLRKAILVNSAEGVCLLIGLGQTVLLTRALGPARVGQYAVLLSALMLAVQISSLGLPMSFLYHAKREPNKTRVYLMNAVWGTLLLGVIGGAAVTLLICWRTAYFGQVPTFALVAIGLFLPVVLQSMLSRNNLMIRIEARRLSAMNICVAGGNLCLVSLCWLSGVLDVGQAVVCFTATALIRYMVGWPWLEDKIDLSIRPTRSESGNLLRMGVRLSWVDLMVLLNSQLSIILVKYFIDDFKDVGFFSRGQRIALLLITAGKAVFPLLFSRWTTYPEDKLAEHVQLVMRFVTTMGMVMIASILLAGKWIVVILYGRAFLPAVEPMLILLPGAVLYLVGRVLMLVLGSRGKPELPALMMLLSVSITAVLSWRLIPAWGIAGAAVASTVGNVALLILLVVIVRRQFNIRITRCLFMGRKDYAYVMKLLRGRNQGDAP